MFLTLNIYIIWSIDVKPKKYNNFHIQYTTNDSKGIQFNDFSFIYFFLVFIYKNTAQAAISTGSISGSRCNCTAATGSVGAVAAAPRRRWSDPQGRGRCGRLQPQPAAGPRLPGPGCQGAAAPRRALAAVGLGSWLRPPGAARFPRWPAGPGCAGGRRHDPVQF